MILEISILFFSFLEFPFVEKEKEKLQDINTKFCENFKGREKRKEKRKGENFSTYEREKKKGRIVLKRLYIRGFTNSRSFKNISGRFLSMLKFLFFFYSEKRKKNHFPEERRKRVTMVKIK